MEGNPKGLRGGVVWGNMVTNRALPSEGQKFVTIFERVFGCLGPSMAPKQGSPRLSALQGPLKGAYI